MLAALRAAFSVNSSKVIGGILWDVEGRLG